MKISIVVSTYNGEKYIIELMDSLFNQKRMADEVLFFDDCSSDDTFDLIAQYINDHNLGDKWKLIRNKHNKGWKKNFIEGMQQATGDLIFPCDQDDVWLPNKLQEMEKIMNEYPKINVLTSNVKEFYSDGRIKISPERNNRDVIKIPICKNFFNVRYPGCTYCVRKSFMNVCVKYWEEDFPHDALFWRIAMFTESLYAYNDSLILWRRHADSTYTVESINTKTKTKKREWCDYAKRNNDMLKTFLEKEGYDNVWKQKLLDESSKWIHYRSVFFDTRSIIMGFRLLRYVNYYSKFKQYIGDWFLVIQNK